MARSWHARGCRSASRLEWARTGPFDRSSRCSYSGRRRDVCGVRAGCGDDRREGRAHAPNPVRTCPLCGVTATPAACPARISRAGRLHCASDAVRRVALSRHLRFEPVHSHGNPASHLLLERHLAFQSVVDIQYPALPMGYTNVMAQLAMYFYIAPINLTTLYPGSYPPANMILLAVSGQSGPERRGSRSSRFNRQATV